MEKEDNGEHTLSHYSYRREVGVRRRESHPDHATREGKKERVGRGKHIIMFRVVKLVSLICVRCGKPQESEKKTVTSQKAQLENTLVRKLFKQFAGNDGIGEGGKKDKLESFLRQRFGPLFCTLFPISLSERL